MLLDAGRPSSHAPQLPLLSRGEVLGTDDCCALVPGAAGFVSGVGAPLGVGVLVAGGSADDEASALGWGTGSAPPASRGSASDDTAAAELGLHQTSVQVLAPRVRQRSA